MNRRTFLEKAAAAAAIASLARPSGAQPRPAIQNVVLVHGLFADGSCWSEVIARLQRTGLNATAVQNPLTTLEESVAATQRVLALQDGPVVLAGHSFAGMIVTEAGADPKAVSLVYVAARAPDAGEDYATLAEQFPSPPASRGLSGRATMGSLPRKLSYAILPAICRQKKHVYFMRYRNRSSGSCSPAGQHMRHGGPSRAGTQFRRRTGRSIPNFSGLWPSGWARRPLR